jgi:hypothetical protein
VLPAPAGLTASTKATASLAEALRAKAEALRYPTARNLRLLRYD